MSLKVRPSDWQADRTLAESVAYAYDNDVACDVTFHVGKENPQEFLAHRLILSLRSPVFFAMFNGGMQPDSKAVIDITDLEPAGFEELLRYIYKEDAGIDPTNAVHTLYAAKKYLVPGLLSKCSAFLERSIHTDNVCVLLEQGLSVDEQALVDSCLGMIMRKSRHVFSSSHWTQLSRTAISIILDSPNLSVPELAAFQACVAWSTAQCESSNQPPIPANLRTQLGDLLYKINMTNLSLSEFSEHVVPTGLLTDSEELVVFKKLTNPALKLSTPFASGRQNCLLQLKPYHILDMESSGECNFDSVTFNFNLTVHNPMRLIELHLYDIIGPHVVNINIKSKPGAVEVPELRYSAKEVVHERQYEEKKHPTFVFHLGSPPVCLSQATYELSLTMLGEFDTDLYEPLQYGDTNLSVTRHDKESPLFGLGYKLDDTNKDTPRPATSNVSKPPAPPPRPPKKEQSTRPAASFALPPRPPKLNANK